MAAARNRSHIEMSRKRNRQLRRAAQQKGAMIQREAEKRWKKRNAELARQAEKMAAEKDRLRKERKRLKEVKQRLREMKERALADKFKMQQVRLERNLLAAVKKQQAQAKLAIASSNSDSKKDWARLESKNKNFNNITLRSEVTFFGRAVSADPTPDRVYVAVNGSLISKKHCCIHKVTQHAGPPCASLQDFSKHGTYINGKRCARHDSVRIENGSEICLQLLPGSQRIAYILQIFGHPNQAPRPLAVLPTPEMLFPGGHEVTNPDADSQPATNVWRPRWAVARDKEAPTVTVAELPLKKPRAPQQEKQDKPKRKKHKKSKGKQKKVKNQFDMFDMFAVDNGNSSNDDGDSDSNDKEPQDGASIDMFSMFPTAKMPKTKKSKKVPTKAVKFLKWSQPSLLGDEQEEHQEEEEEEDEEAFREKEQSNALAVASKQPEEIIKAQPLANPVPASKLSVADAEPAQVPVDDGLSNKQRQRRARLKKWKQTKQRELMKMQARVGRWESVGGLAPGISTTSTNKAPATSAEIPKQTGPSWEAYTKGFGSRMLQRMGYKKGQGLRRDGSGLVDPIEVEQHPAGMGLDMIGKQRQTKRKRQARQDAQSEGSGFYKMMGVKADDIEKQRAFARQRILAQEVFDDLTGPEAGIEVVADDALNEASASLKPWRKFKL